MPSSDLSLGHLLRDAKSVLNQAGIESYGLDAEVLLSHVLNKDRVYLLTHPEYVLNEREALDFAKAVSRRAKHEPIAYLTGRKEFMGLDFWVCDSDMPQSRALIPRADTETLVTTVIDAKPPYLLDLCTGTGCIGISALVYGGCECCVAVDVDPTVLRIAQRNADELGVAECFQTLQMDILSDGWADQIAVTPRFDAIVSNPPYITASEMNTLSPDVHDYEPHAALYGGEDGLIFYRLITREGIKLLNKNGLLAFEIGAGQAKDVMQLLSDNGFVDIQLKTDLSGKDRVVWGRKAI